MKRSQAPTQNKQNKMKFVPPAYRSIGASDNLQLSSAYNLEESEEVKQNPSTISIDSLNSHKENLFNRRLTNNTVLVGEIESVPAHCSSRDKSSIQTEVTTEIGVYIPQEIINKPAVLKVKKSYPILKQYPVNNADLQTKTFDDGIGQKTKYFSTVWRKKSFKKHKVWEGDAVMVVHLKSITLYDMDGKQLDKINNYKAQETGSLMEGSSLTVCSKEIEILGIIEEESYLSGKCFSSHTTTLTETVQPKHCSLKKSEVGLGLLGNKKIIQGLCQKKLLEPRFDPNSPGALVLPQPPQLSTSTHGTEFTDVVVDPHLSAHLRPHQRDGVSFLYECIMGYKNTAGCGAILADEMGLGKTLQIITLLWTLLKQNPFSKKPLIKKALIVTPGSLVQNWRKEFQKWLGKERINVFAIVNEQNTEDFKNSLVHPVMIVSYEMFLRYYENIQETKFDLLVCDEGHRLKNSAIKTAAKLQLLPTKRRILVTGTPIQNDLKEFFCLVDFCNPGLLGNSSSFRKIFEEPILKSKEPNCSTDERLLGEERAAELNRLTSFCVLRRTSEINQQYLPPKVESVLFCKLSAQQRELYKQVVKSCQIASLISCSSDGSAHLTSINELKKICNHPSLHNPDFGQNQPTLGQSIPPPTFSKDDLSSSGKLNVLSLMFKTLKEDGQVNNDKMVVVSNYTQTLDILETVCLQCSLAFLRLDGQTPVNRRQDLVDKFNARDSSERVFLLSAKAGGVGLNLVGANRLILYDIDWNPATDAQAMARVWRDGQRKTVFIYRLLTSGTIEEKIYQRQLSKQSLQTTVVDTCQREDVKLSIEDLKDLFTYKPEAECDTHDILLCSCFGQNPQLKVQPSENMSQLHVSRCLSQHLKLGQFCLPSDSKHG